MPAQVLVGATDDSCMGPSDGARHPAGRAATPRVVAVALLAICGLAGCASGDPSAHSGTVVRVTERDFRITASRTRVPAGDVLLTVENRGPVSHELIVVRKGSPSLPRRADGVTIDEDALEKAIAGALEPGQPGRVRELRVHLKPGRYELFCNMSGHFLGGMHTDLVVT
jgi:uncharacterized cupredoxin-like copper-binding protein